MPRHRWVAAALAALGLFALLLQLWLSLHNAPTTHVSEAKALWRYFGYFTILTNIAVVLALLAWRFGPRCAPLRFACSAPAQTAVTVAIVIVAIVYHLLLSHLWQPQGWQWLADQLLHTVMPLLFVLHWWFAVPKAALRWRHVWTCLPYPAAYAVYAIVRGACDGWYPYPFIDVATLGYPRVAVNASAIFVAFALTACGLIAIGRWQSRRQAV